MMRIRLCTNHGEYVATVEIVPFLTLPEVVGWGERVFVYKYSRIVEGAPGNSEPVYHEAFTTWSTTPSPGLPK